MVISFKLGYIAVSLCSCFLLIPSYLCSQEQSIEKKGASYRIIPGDCLWNIAKKFYNNPFNWKLIWSANPYIKNPDLIYPGDVLFIPEVEMGESLSSMTPVESEEIKGLEKEDEPPEHNVGEGKSFYEEISTHVPKMVSIGIEKRTDFQLELEPESFVVESVKVDYDGIIIGVSERKLLIAEGDIVHLNIGRDKNLNVGDKFRILRKVSLVRDPVTGDVKGSVVLKVGILEVIDVANNISSARIIMSHHVVRIGDFVKKM